MLFLSLVSACLLFACSDHDNEGDNNNSIQFTDAINDYHVWFKITETNDEEFGATSTIREIYVFSDDTISVYPVDHLLIKDIIDLSDDELENLMLQQFYAENVDSHGPEPLDFSISLTQSSNEEIVSLSVETIPKTIFSIVDEKISFQVNEVPLSGLQHEDFKGEKTKTAIVTIVHDSIIKFTTNLRD